MTGVRVATPRDLKGALLAIESCRDGRKVVYKNGDGSKDTGRLIHYTAYFKRDKDGRLKVSTWSGKRVKSCPA